MDDLELGLALSRLPRRPAPAALRRSLEDRWAPRVRRATFAGWLAAAAAFALVVATVATLVMRAGDRSDAMVKEAVNDHLRVLYGEHPVEIESGGVHQVKPWFAGRLDFAPVLAFGGDDDFPLKGGAVAYFIDRKAAAFVFGRRLHVITLLLFPADGLPWPAGGGIHATTTRGFHTLLWRSGDLGYALVSDVAEVDLQELARRVREVR